MPRRSKPKDGNDSSGATPRIVGISLDPEEVALLTALGAIQQLSPGLLAKKWILERLRNPEVLGSWPEEVRKLHDHLGRIHRDVALGFQVAVASTGAVTPKEAQAWADHNFRGKPYVVDQQPH